MDIEELSKSQIVLLTLLVSFVTSIATGIVTVSLMDQAPPAIAQTVNRVIERTVEKVVPSEGQAAASVVTTEKTVVVKESDLIVQAVEKMTPSLVRIQSNAEESVFLGLGIVLDAAGTIVTDAAALGDSRAEAVISLSDGTSVRAFVVSRDSSTGIAFLETATTTRSGKPTRWTAATLSADTPVLGQTVVALSGRTIPRIADGLVVALIPRETDENIVIDTNVSPEFIMGGSPLINVDGGVVGVSTSVSRASSQKGFVAATMLVKPKAIESSEDVESEE